MRGLAAEYAAAGDPVEPPAPVDGIESIEDGAVRLVAAIEAGDLDDVDRLALWLGDHATATELRHLLAQPVAASLAAAAHASILLYLLPRVAVAAHVPVSIVRGPARELARNPGWRLRWFEDPDGIVTTSTTLADALLDVPMLGLPGNNFIFPIMSQAEESGIAAQAAHGRDRRRRRVSGPRPGADRGRVDARGVGRPRALRVEPLPDDAASRHCARRPRLRAADRDRGSGNSCRRFRAALGERSLNAGYHPAAPVTTNLTEAVATSQADAAATVWHAPDDALDDIATELATRAALHHDAHLVKYTLACFDAAAADPGERRLYLSAAASLSAWWAQFPD